MTDDIQEMPEDVQSEPETEDAPIMEGVPEVPEEMEPDQVIPVSIAPHVPSDDFQWSTYAPPEPRLHVSTLHTWMVTNTEDGKYSCKPWSFNGEARIVDKLGDLP